MRIFLRRENRSSIKIEKTEKWRRVGRFQVKIQVPLSILNTVIVVFISDINPRRVYHKIIF